MATPPRSRWALKEGGGQYVYQPPVADYFVSPSYSDQQIRGSNVRYPITVADPNPNSAYVRCYRSAERFDLCEKTYGCCTASPDGCCPKDEWWMAGVYVLIAFTVITAVIALIIGLVCYKRSSSQKKKERMYYSTSGSVVGSQPYESDVGSRRSIAPY